MGDAIGRQVVTPATDGRPWGGRLRRGGSATYENLQCSSFSYST